MSNSNMLKNNKSRKNKESIKIFLTEQIISRINNIFEQNQQECQLKSQSQNVQEEQKQLITDIKNAAQDLRAELQKTNKEVEKNKKLTQAEKAYYSEKLVHIDVILKQLTSKKQFKLKFGDKLKIQFITNANSPLYQFRAQLQKLEKTGSSGLAQVREGVRCDFNKLEKTLVFWQLMENLDTSNEKSFIAPTFNERETKQYLLDLLEEYIQINEDVQVKEVTKEVIKYVDKVQTKVVEKIVGDEQSERLRQAHEQLHGFAQPQQIDNAIGIYEDLAKQHKNVYALNALGQIYLEGKFADKNLDKSYLYYLKSANESNSEGQYRMGQFYEYAYINDIKQMPVKERLTQAYQYYTKSSKQQHVMAQLTIARFYQDGLVDPGQAPPQNTIVAQNLDHAENIYQEVYKTQYPQGIHNYGEFLVYHKKNRDFEDYRKAFKLFQSASDKRIQNSIFEMGQCYYRGEGIGKDKNKALQHYQKAVKYGDDEARLYYAQILIQQASFDDNNHKYVEAYSNLKLVVDQSNEQKYIAEANYFLGLLFEYGYGVEMNIQIANDYYNNSAQLGKREAFNKLGDLHFTGKGGQKSLVMSKQYYEQGVKLGENQCMENLGAIYQDNYSERSDRGDHVADIPKAIALYEQSVKHGNTQAHSHLADIYEKQGNFDQARIHLKKGIENEEFHSQQIFKSKFGVKAQPDQLNDEAFQMLYTNKNLTKFLLPQGNTRNNENQNPNSHLNSNQNSNFKMVDSSFQKQ